MRNLVSRTPQRAKGFSLVEVVLAIGIFLVTVLALVGLLGPTLQSVDKVAKTDEVSSVVNSVNAFLQGSSVIAPNGSRFDVIYNAVAADHYATVFVFREYISALETKVQLSVGFDQNETVAGASVIDPLAEVTDFTNAAGPIYRVVLTPSSVIPTPTLDPDQYRSEVRNTSTGTYELNAVLEDYLEGYFAMEVRIYVESPPAPTDTTYNEAKNLTDLVDFEPIFTYNTAIVR
ncbi:MAG: prepilin-type N-terminal cleavage/methylation domain-containing protein [Opitutales bacterium]|jgi:type II secretory pathway pseudopilin PulG|nr:prepilin-type N-terminal cleavage/methylation domain-containing protein [Opitutales bacterium]